MELEALREGLTLLIEGRKVSFLCLSLAGYDDDGVAFHLTLHKGSLPKGKVIEAAQEEGGGK